MDVFTQWAFKKVLHPSDKVALALMIDAADENFYLSQDVLEELFSTDRRVYNLSNRLERWGLIETERAEGKRTKVVGIRILFEENKDDRCFGRSWR